MKLSRAALCSLLLVVLTACTAANVKQTPYNQKKYSQTFERLIVLNDLNERAFAYHHYCLRKNEPMNEQFLKNLEETANLLFDETVVQTNLKPQHVADKILKRRSTIQQALSRHYHTKGCQSAEAMIARDHYRAFS